MKFRLRRSEGKLNFTRAIARTSLRSNFTFAIAKTSQSKKRESFYGIILPHHSLFCFYRKFRICNTNAVRLCPYPYSNSPIRTTPIWQVLFYINLPSRIPFRKYERCSNCSYRSCGYEPRYNAPTVHRRLPLQRRPSHPSDSQCS